MIKKLTVTQCVHEITRMIGPNVGLSGGKTPIPVYEMLGRSLNLDLIDFFVVDERKVPRNHEDSNYRMISESLAPPKLHDFDTTLPVEEALKAYEDELLAAGSLDLCLLGVGPDGHFASIFPGVKEPGRLVMATETNDFAVRERLTMTSHYILNSKNIMVLLQNKPNVIEELESGTLGAAEFPAKMLLKHPSLVIADIIT